MSENNISKMNLLNDIEKLIERVTKNNKKHLDSVPSLMELKEKNINIDDNSYHGLKHHFIREFYFLRNEIYRNKYRNIDDVLLFIFLLEYF